MLPLSVNLPASSLAEALTKYAGQYRVDPDTGKATFAIIQAEDELAARAARVMRTGRSALAARPALRVKVLLMTERGVSGGSDRGRIGG